MKPEIIPTADGSVTIAIPSSGVTYHSKHGAIQESMHVFIGAGLHYMMEKDHTYKHLRILEMGFGTGLNALLTLHESQQAGIGISYETLEAFPLEADIYTQLNYCDQMQAPELQPYFLQLHTCNWNSAQQITPGFSFTKQRTTLQQYNGLGPVDLIYYDAFAPSAQPELWTTEIFNTLHKMLVPGGILTTYCSKGDVRRAMMAAGFSIEKIPGPPGKREMVRASKLG
ncbi:tRNA (5-methylaminomethyl-2-thiouridine)(34)-methyltransferase MnmD [Pseudoflavitalea sp. G-6-1-2]|uniref:tRNA (5-methylaminomethyl-2-thiouridine)(34)-methyltransferase MnmD n=1 Tax=Pseudoflavitalea sp. G-6-1-2 TaxID=2728841 RepID=UPI00146A4CD1|nr:tRNA (5-methylaminomethyl-2-thiouridine)(34)-methyltransferase MnmD [Pseudoflavitalea sp. G-6-1-2]NML20182.1 tRNA (5-methylaminomethyl-2-thiouridine)(34)-methyltransferase MnmD [Pseudoflavitalea sp. G-6-1-2]